MYDPNHNASPVNPIPPVVLGLVALIALFEIAFQLGERGLAGGAAAIQWRVQALQTFGFYPSVWDQLVTAGRLPVDGAWRFVTYPLVHASFVHTLFACVLLLALGNFTARVFRPVALVLVLAACLIAGAIAFAVTNDTGAPLYGAYPAAYGLIGMYTWCLWTMADRMGRNPYAAFQLIGVLVGIQLLFVVLEGAWYSFFAEIAGFVTGFVLAAPAAPGGIARLRQKLRGR
ncbi:rhomboid family intramembrane serine protease [Rhodobacteraceae bacterium 2CG4]|uniref:Rhomboid family intramembrane serine protease n=1 Tax=Halovulum marinum TaxID=2662447 RepID=A0A6L5YZ54_9RHOB|nr:rhomboid family intramembrane serine protease [Halovulum marinum]MSU89553.1 rhomboid family intramembrane serine protease [Halovulum marinum]